MTPPKGITALFIVVLFIAIASAGYYLGEEASSEPSTYRSPTQPTIPYYSPTPIPPYRQPITTEGLERPGNGTNIAWGKPVVEAIGQVDYSDYKIRFNPQNITDGDVKSGWRTITDNGTQAIIDLQGHYDISEVAHVVTWDSASGFDQDIQFRISASENDDISYTTTSDWTELVTAYLSPDQNAQKLYHEVAAQNVRFIKVEYVHEDEEWGGWGNIEEIEVYAR